MIRRLIILLLIAGCGTEPEGEEPVCSAELSGCDSPDDFIEIEGRISFYCTQTVTNTGESTLVFLSHRVYMDYISFYYDEVTRPIISGSIKLPVGESISLDISYGFSHFTSIEDVTNFESSIIEIDCE